MSAIKGFQSLYLAIENKIGTTLFKLQQKYASLQEIGGGRVGLDTLTRYMTALETGIATTSDSDNLSVLNITGHPFRIGDFLRFETGGNAGIELQVVKTNANQLMLGGRMDVLATAGDTVARLRSISPTVDVNGSIQVVEGQTEVVDFLDAGTMVPTGVNAIPASSSPPLEVVASLAKAVTKIQSISDVGEFINIYSDSAGTNLIAHLVLTPDEEVDVNLAAGTSLYLRAAKNVAIDDPNSVVQFNLIGAV